METVEWDLGDFWFCLRRESADVELLLPSAGWVHAHLEYSITCIEQDGPQDGTIWTIASWSDRAAAQLAKGLVIEDDVATSDEGVAMRSIFWWEIPEARTKFPAHLSKGTVTDIETWLLKRCSKHTEASAPNNSSSNAPLTRASLASVELSVVEFLSKASTHMAAKGGFEIDRYAIAAALGHTQGTIFYDDKDHYTESWRWRLAFRASRANVPGILTVEASHLGLCSSRAEAADESGLTLDGAWLTLPANESVIELAAPGARLRIK